MFAKFLYCLIYNNKNHIDLSMIFSIIVWKRASPASSRSYCIYTGIPKFKTKRLLLTESLYLFTPDGVRVPKFTTKRLLLRIESVAKN